VKRYPLLLAAFAIETAAHAEDAAAADATVIGGVLGVSFKSSKMQSVLQDLFDNQARLSNKSSYAVYTFAVKTPAYFNFEKEAK
jgi:hypothetical protein